MENTEEDEELAVVRGEEEEIAQVQAEEEEDGEKPKSKPGIIYISSLVPGMTPGVVKSILQKHAPIKRIFLEPEDASVRRRRISAGGGSGERFIEGWVEFYNKKDAKNLALLLNGSRVGPKKSSRFYEDRWVMKYLSGFTWEMLREKTHAERRQRESKLKLLLAKDKKNDEEFLKKLAHSKKIRAIDERKGNALGKRQNRTFKQIQPIQREKMPKLHSSPEPPPSL